MYDIPDTLAEASNSVTDSVCHSADSLSDCIS
jgi:hypothetical protein